jgi:SlyX protein
MSTDARITELETRIAFAEHTIQELNGALAEQQKQLMALNRVHELLLEKLQSLQASGDTEFDSNERPPHY